MNFLTWRCVAVAACLAASVSTQADPRPAAPFDVLIRGGSVVDGTRTPARQCDVAIRGDRIVAVGEIAADATAALEIDAAGMVVAPGFIDAHTHAESIERQPDAWNFVGMGVTTLISGNCGSSRLDLGTAFDRLENGGGIGPNYASLIGHGTVRREVLGIENRAPTDAELERMCELVRAAMADGAVGLSTGLIYVPGTYAETEELIALARVVAEFGGVYASHMRNEGDRVLASIDEALRIGREAGVAVHLSHLKASGKPNWGRSVDIVARLTAAREAGVRVTGDQYAYAASSTSLDVLFPSAALSIGRKEFGAKLRDDEPFRARMHEALLATMERSGFGDFSYCQIASAPGHRDLSGKTLAEAASGDGGRDAQARLAIDLMIAAAGKRISMVYHKMSEDDVETLMRVPFIAVASDGGIRNRAAASKPHPRSVGNNPRVLARYVREQKTLSLELAIHKMTQLPATVFGLRGRGVLAEGAFADVVVFDPDAVQDGATFDDPLEPPRGIDWVLVNGRVAHRKGEQTEVRAGAVLRHSARTR